jgi:tetratricopeptide (TPR) repeat protein
MTTRIPVFVILLALGSAATGVTQSTTPSASIEISPAIIPGISRPPELKGKAKTKVVQSQSAADKAFWDVFKQAGHDGFTEANLPALDKFIHDYPSYADGYYWRANVEACGKNPLNLVNAKSDLEASLSHTGDPIATFEKKQVLSLLAKVEFASGNRTAALDQLERAMEINLDSADQIFNIDGTSPETTSTFCTWNLTDLRSLASSAPMDWRPIALEGLYYEFFTTFDEHYTSQARAALQKAALASNRTPIVPYLQGKLLTHSAFWTKSASDSARDASYRSAIAFFTKAIQLKSSFELAYSARAEAYLDLKQYNLAIRDFDKVLSIDPDNKTAHSDRGIANAEARQYFAAISDFGEAIRAMHEGDDYLPNDYENRADAYVKVHEYRQAIEDYSSAIELRLQNQVLLMSLKQFRNLYPEYSAVSDDALLQEIQSHFAPQYEMAAFRAMMAGNEGKWSISLLNDLYEKRGNAYLSIGDYGRGILDFHRIFVGMPNFGAYTERWRPIGVFGNGEKVYIDVKASDTQSDRFPRIWVRSVEAKRSEVMAFEIDCTARRLSISSNLVYDANNNMVGGSDAGQGWSDIAPDTLGEQLWNGACQSNP